MHLPDLSGPAEVVARQLLGCELVRTLNGQQLVGRIVETEAYHQSDAASHSYRGKTPRTEIMFGPPGYAYVYFTYGMHYCMNVVTGPEGEGSAVLIRALEPLQGIETMRQLRPHKPDHQLTNRPAKLCYAFAINKSLNGHRLDVKPLLLQPGAPIADEAVVTTTRIGISQAQDTPWRFYIRGNSFVSQL